MTSAELQELRIELGTHNKDFLMKFFYSPIVKFLTINEPKFKGQLAKYGIKDIRKIPSKEDMITLVFKLYADEAIVKGFVGSNNERDQTILNRAVWEGGVTRKDLEIFFKKQILTSSGKSYYTKIELIPEVKSVWGDYIAILEPSGYYGDSERFIENTDVLLSFPLPLRKLLAIQLPKPKGYQFQPIPEPSSSFKVYHTESTIFSEFPRFLAYHGQGNIKYSQKGNPNHASAKKMFKALKTVEFAQDSAFPIRSLLIAGLFGEDFKMKVITDSPEQIIKKLFSKDFEKKQVAPYMLTHLKGLNFFNWNEYRPNTTNTILHAFRQMPQGDWISLDNLQDFVQGRFLPILPLKEWILRDRVQAEFEADENDKVTKWTIRLNVGNIHEFVWRPYLAGHVYLLAAFGLMDIAIDPNVENQHSAYENLHAFRLTKLGAYVLGFTKNYTPPERENRTSLSFDENSPIIRIEGDVLLGDTLLANYATRVSENRYQFSHGRFLKECKSTKDIQNKIALFKQTIGQKLPSFWEDYLQELVNNSKSIAPQQLIKVFTIPAENKALQRIIVQDDVIRKLVIKAEQYHLLVSEANLSAFTNRMKELGYVLG